MGKNILEVNNLSTVFIKDKNELKVLKEVSFNLEKGRVLGIVGESGCGKSVTVNTILNLLPKNGKIKEGNIKFYDDSNVIELEKLKQYGKEFRSLRGNKISMIFQDPMSALNPVYTIGDQVAEVLHEHYKLTKKEAREKTIEMLDKLGIPNAKDRIDDYPHQFSGGQRQRVVIAIAMICNPDILIADEPTTALDVTIQAQILDLLRELKRETQTAIIVITHDLGVVAQIADDVAVMYAGEIVEIAPVKELFESPKHPYTRSLLQSIPNPENVNKKLHVIEGMVPPISELPEKGCRFAPRIPWISEDAHEENPKLHKVSEGHYVRCSCYKHFEFEKKEEESLPEKIFGDVILEVKNLKKHYAPKKKLFGKKGITVKALDDVSFTMREGMTIGIVGESGCGKSTLAKSLMKLHNVTSGSIELELNGEKKDIFKLNKKEEFDFRKRVQMVFQDPYSSLNPTKKIYDSFDEPMSVHKLGTKEERYQIMLEALRMVNLPEEYLHRYPHEFSGGQRQRLCIARALCMSPDILLLDEPVSALDLSVQAQVLNYLQEIQQKQNLTYIFISHDLGVVKYMCDYIYVIHKGRFVEAGTTEDIYNNPQHIYTKRLLSAIPEISVEQRDELLKQRIEVEENYRKEFSNFYDENGRVLDLKKISDTHYVAMK